MQHARGAGFSLVVDALIKSPPSTVVTAPLRLSEADDRCVLIQSSKRRLSLGAALLVGLTGR